MQLSKLLNGLFIKKCHKELYKEASSMAEFEMLCAIYDRYGKSVTDRLTFQSCHNVRDAYRTYMKQVLELKNDIKPLDIYNTLECLMIRETLLVEEKSYNQMVFESLIQLGSTGAFYLEDLLYTIAKDTSLLDYFSGNLTHEELIKLFNLACHQLSAIDIDRIKPKYIWSTLEV